MLDPDFAEDLRTIAEVAVTMAGFVAIVGALQLHREAKLDVRSRAWMVSILATGVQAAFLALVPLILARVPPLEENFWRWCHAVSWIFWARVSFLGRPVRVILGALNFIDWIIVPMGMVIFLFITAIVLGWSTPYAPVIYLWLLMQLLLVNSVMFVRQFAADRGLAPSIE